VVYLNQAGTIGEWNARQAIQDLWRQCGPCLSRTSHCRGRHFGRNRTICPTCVNGWCRLWRWSEAGKPDGKHVSCLNQDHEHARINLPDRTP